jgi:CubicO group peptidase (beta-lactamase class C family)
MSSKITKFKASLTAILIVIISTSVLSGFVLSCDPNIQEKQQAYKDILGYWKSYRADIAKENPGLHKIIINSKGKLVQSLIYDSGAQSSIWINDERISYSNGHLEFWGDEFKGEMSKDKNSIQLKYNASIPFVWERIHNQKTIEFINSLEAEASLEREYSYRIPEETGDGWECTDMADAGINKERIIKCVNRIKNGKYDDIHSVLIVKDGRLVVEEYFGAEGKIWGPFVNQVFRDHLHHQSSVAKSVISTVIMIAADKGYIKDFEEPLFKYFPEFSYLNNENKQKIKLKHVLSMSSGLDWDESSHGFNDSRNTAYQWMRSDHHIRFVLERPVADEPGTVFNYGGHNMMLAAEIVKRSTGTPVDKFAEEYLFNPLEIKKYKWLENDTLVTLHTGGLSISPRSMAKIGQLYLNNGNWKGTQVIPEDLINESVREHVKNSNDGYGYMWWRRHTKVNNKIISSVYAIGAGGQFILLFHDLDMVVVFTANSNTNRWSSNVYDMLREYIIPAAME